MPTAVPAALSPLRVARHLRGLSAKDLSEQVGCTGAWISQIERFSREISPEKIDAFSRALRVPASFLQAGPIENTAGILHFRHLRNTPAVQRDRVHARAVLLRLLIRQIGQEFQRLPAPDVPEVHLPGEPGDPARIPLIERAAGDLRRRWGMGMGAIPDVVRQVEARGIWVICLPPEDRSVSAFSWWGDGHAFIALNPVSLDGHDVLEDGEARNAYRERFNVAHELGHLILHSSLRTDDVGTRPVENEAHRFAASFLVPATEWIATAERSMDWRRYREASQSWGVSATVLLRRNLDLKLWPEPVYRAAMIRVSGEIGRKAEGRHLLPRIHETPGRLVAHLRSLAGAGVTLDVLAERLSVDVRDLDDLVTEPTAPAPLRSGTLLPFPVRR